MDARAWQVQGAKAYKAGDLAGAAEALQRASDLDPQNAEYLRHMADIARLRGRFDEAAAFMARADLVARVAAVQALNLTASNWLDLGRREEALAAAGDALALRDNASSRALAMTAMRRMDQIAPAYRPILVRALDEGWMAGHGMRPATVLMRANWPETLSALAADELLAALLRAGPLRDAVIEAKLTDVRANLLTTATPPELWPFQSRLAAQCFINEYVWRITPQEAARVAEMRDAPRTPGVLIRLASYMSLGELPDAEAILAADWPAPIQDLVRQQIAEPAEERRLAADIRELTPIRPGVSQAVKAMYEENPYPRWVKPSAELGQPLERVLRSSYPHARIDPVPNAEAPQVLIAGCGTGAQAVNVARRYVGAQLLAVDLSRTSLAYALRKTREAGVTNIEYGVADILELTELLRREGRGFDLIEVTGVLHHMADPKDAARRLADLLRPGGVIRFGLYSATARAVLQPARELAKSYPATPDGIRALRERIAAAPPGDPLQGPMGSGDFYSTSNCRDLLMHVHEQQQTLDDLRAMLDGAGLRLIGFELPSETLNDYRARFPDDPAAVDLENWKLYEADHPQMFLSMYVFWGQRPAA